MYVGNLPPDAAEADVEALFSRAGAITDIRRHAAPDGRLQAFAFVQFADAASARRAASGA